MRRPALLLRVASLTAVLALAAGCHHDESAAAIPAPPTSAAAVTAAAATPASPPRAKPDFGGTSTRHVEAIGVGSTLDAAVDNAIRQAIEQVNGKTVSGGAASLTVAGNLAAGDQHLDYGSAQYASWLSSQTSGAVTGFRLLSQEQVDHPVTTDEQHLAASQGESWNKGKFEGSADESAENHGSMAASNGDASVEAAADANRHASASASGEWDQRQGASKVDYDQKHTEFSSHWQVRIAADVATYREAAGARLTRMVIAMPRVTQESYRVGDNTIPANEISTQVRKALNDAMVQTRRFTVLDRDATQEMAQEIDLIQSGNARREDTARLGQQLATDLIVIPTIDRFEYIRHERSLRLSDRTLASYSGGGALSFRVVNAATGQIVLSQTFSYALPDTAPTTLGASADGPRLAAEMMDSLDRQIAGAILQSTFPLSVVQRDGRSLVINQGGENVNVGATYQAVTLGKEILDPQSGLSLGPTETPCCTVVIDRVTPSLSYAHIVGGDVDTSTPFTPGSMELRDRIDAATEPDAAPVASSRSKAKPVVKTTVATKPAEDKNW